LAGGFTSPFSTLENGLTTSPAVDALPTPALQTSVTAVALLVVLVSEELLAELEVVL
jgi:hypothetical protein